MSTVTHAAGNFICFGSKFVQRCMVCGEILTAGDTANMAGISTRPDEKWDVGRWETGTLVQCDAGDADAVRRSVRVGELSQDFKPEDLPPDFCLELVEEIR